MAGRVRIAGYLFETATRALDPHGKGWTPRRLRHSAPRHLAAAPPPASRPGPATLTWPALALTSAAEARRIVVPDPGRKESGR